MTLFNSGICEHVWAVLKDQNTSEMWGLRRSYQSRLVPDLIQLFIQNFINMGSSGDSEAKSQNVLKMSTIRFIAPEMLSVYSEQQFTVTFTS